jgi:transposase
MAQPKRGYSLEFKKEVLAYMTSLGKTLKETAEHFGVTTTTLRDWRRRLGSPPGATPAAGETPEQELRRLRRENRELQMRCEILKKTVGIFSELDTNAAARSKP